MRWTIFTSSLKMPFDVFPLSQLFGESGIRWWRSLFVISWSRSLSNTTWSRSLSVISWPSLLSADLGTCLLSAGRRACLLSADREICLTSADRRVRYQLIEESVWYQLIEESVCYLGRKDDAKITAGGTDDACNLSQSKVNFKRWFRHGELQTGVRRSHFLAYLSFVFVYPYSLIGGR